MHSSDAIKATAEVAPNDLASLSDVLSSPELIGTCLEEAGIATLP